MAKKKKVEEVVEEPLVEETVVMEAPEPEPVYEPVPEPVIEKPVEEKWEIKDRLYYLNGNKKPLSYIIKSAGLYWFDEEKGYEREIKYCQNQKTPFVDEMQGEHRLSHIIFRSGTLFVEKEKTVLQKFLSLYHPHNGRLFYEYKPQAIAESEIDIIEMEIAALNAAQDIDIDMAEAVMRVEIGSKVSQMSSKELRRDLLVYAKKNPRLFLELVNDENVMLRNFGIKATELGILKISSDQRTFMWGTNNRKLFTVPFDEHPFSALAAWFKTDEGLEIYRNIEKRLN